MRHPCAASHGDGIGLWRASLAGCAAVLVGIGLARFAYTPLIPALIGAGWFSPSEAAYLGAANLAGYLVGAILGRRLATRVATPLVLRAMMILAAVAFLACAGPLPFGWFSLWRFAAGLAGGVLMVLAAPSVLARLSPSRRGLAGGIIFTGVGLGIAASGTLIPWLLELGLVETWLGLGAISLALAAASWRAWIGDPPTTSATAVAAGVHPAPRASPVLIALYLEYGLIAFGLVPHMVFLVDFVARGLDQGLDVGARTWVLFGVGAMLGPIAAGRLADRIGFRAALRLGLFVVALAVGWPAVSADAAGLAVSSVVAGAFVPGCVVLVLGRTQELVAADLRARAAAWSRATALFAVGQALAAYGFSFLFARSGEAYTLLFTLGAAALLLALAIDLAAAALRRSGG